MVEKQVIDGNVDLVVLNTLSSQPKTLQSYHYDVVESRYDPVLACHYQLVTWTDSIMT
jgi:hypothetical protein